MTSDQPKQRPEGKLIEDAAKLDPRSIRQLAPLAGMSDARWRQITKGYQSVGGNHVEVIAPAMTLARMALVLGIPGEELIAVGRRDASDALTKAAIGRQITDEVQFGDFASAHVTPARSSTGRSNPLGEIDMIYNSTSMTAQQKLEAIRMVLRLRAQAEKEAAAATGEVDETQPQVKPSSR